MTPRSAFVKWSLIGSVVAGIMVLAQTVEVGGVAGLIQVGEASALRPIIEDELGRIPLSERGGHDGQIFYAIGIDLIGDEVAPLLDHGVYRYRRILYPALASLGGILDGRALLYGMIVMAVVSMGIASGTVAALAAKFEKSDWFALVVVLNPGVWLSVRLLTGDATALAAMALGLLAVVMGWRSAALLFTASGLAKDVYLLTPAGLMVNRQTRRWSLLLVPAALLAMWTIYVAVTIEGGFTEGGNLTWPFVGIVNAGSHWSFTDFNNLFYLLFALLSVAIGLVHGLRRRTWLRWPVLGWSVLGVISSDFVWDLGNNAARAFAPIVVLVAAGELARSRRQDDPTAYHTNSHR